MISLIKNTCKPKLSALYNLRSALLSSNETIINKKGDPKIKFRFLEEKTGDLIEVKAVPGVSVLDVALENNIDIEGACGGQMACSTCHVVVDKDLYDKLPTKVEEEDDMLDLAWGLTDTSRLCCQIKVTDLLEGKTFKVPKDTHNML